MCSSLKDGISNCLFVKNTISRLFLLITFSCSSVDPEPEAFEDLKGSWIFADKKVSGEIWISNLAGLETIDRKGYFSFETYSFAVSDRSRIRYNTNDTKTIDYLYLVSLNNFGIVELYLLDGQVKDDFTEVVFSSFVVIRAQTTQDVFEREIVMKRK